MKLAPQNMLFIDATKTTFGWISFCISDKGLLFTSFMYPSKSKALKDIRKKIASTKLSMSVAEEQLIHWQKVFKDYFDESKTQQKDIPIDNTHWNEISEKVYAELSNIDSGATMSYGEIAKKINKPKAARAIGRIVGKNPVAPIIPCHRVVSKNKKLTGFSAEGGVELKKRMLSNEGVDL